MPTVSTSLACSLLSLDQAGAGPAAVWGRPAVTVFGRLKTRCFTVLLLPLLVGRVIRFLSAALIWAAMAVVLGLMAVSDRVRTGEYHRSPESEDGFASGVGATVISVLIPAL